MTLKELYNYKLALYKQEGIREELDRLLALLLLSEKDNYEPLKVAEGVFYEKYKNEIDEKIKKVETDFELTKEDIIKYIEAEGMIVSNYEDNKIWYVFAEGFGSMHWGNMYRKDSTAEEIYSEYFHSNELLTLEMMNKYPNLYNECLETKGKNLKKNK